MKNLLTLFFLFSVTISFSQKKKYEIKNIKLNDDKSQYGLMYYQNNKVYFTAYTLNEFGTENLSRTGLPIFGLYEAERTSDGEVINVKRFRGADNFEFNSSSAAFSHDGRYMYITTNDVKRGEIYKRNDKTRNLRIERGEYVEGQGWTNFITLSFCDDNYSYAHPALSPDGRYLYFVSNIPSAKGPTDVFRVTIDGDNKFGDPENLGDHINSVRRDTFPTISNDNVLYFSSDRAGGTGGLDIYKCVIGADNKVGDPELMSAPINSRLDDFCYILNSDGTEGYLSSNRARGKGQDDVYYFKISE